MNPDYQKNGDTWDRETDRKEMHRLPEIGGNCQETGQENGEYGRKLIEYLTKGGCVRCGELIVRVSFADTQRTLGDCISEYMRSDVL